MADTTAFLLLRSAAIDVAACKALDAAPDMVDTVIGFHAQQACEKCLNAVLSAQGVEFSRTHDLLRLVESLAARGIDIPAAAMWIDELHPYAVEARYGMVASGALNRQRALATIDELLAWASMQVSGGAAI